MDTRNFLLDALDASWRLGGAPQRVLAAVSGGADSVALLWLLKELRGQSGILLSAVHVDHGLRQESGEDAAFVQRLCSDWQIDCQVIRVQVKGASEAAARDMRYAALTKAYQQQGAQAIALAHHQRDQAETVLLHLCRGSGTTGLCGMRAWSSRMLPDGQSMRLWRPMLDVSPEILRRLLNEQSILWREDRTNSQDDYLRNFLRHQILPRVKERIPRAQEAMGRAALIMQDEEDYLEQTCRAFLRQNANLHPPCRFLLREPFLQLHTALQRRVLRLASPVSLDYETTERALALSPGEWMNLAEGWRMLIRPRCVHFVPPVREPGQLEPLEQLSFHGYPGDGKRMQAIPNAMFSQAQLRFRLPGDRIHPLGGKGEKSLQDYLVDRKIDQPFRDYVPLLCRGNRVLWAIGIGPGEEARITPETDAVLLQYHGFLPGEISKHE